MLIFTRNTEVLKKKSSKNNQKCKILYFSNSTLAADECLNVHSNLYKNIWKIYTQGYPQSICKDDLKLKKYDDYKVKLRLLL